ncbi:MAG TPA: helix-turn-helix domain-containing protein [Verrucomicrobiae bacterium]|nr:helix-turn-helix domain-containing protein [Verrucomicrobiae bacterium]
MKDFRLGPEQEAWLRSELKQAANTQAFRRAAALLAIHEGHTTSEIAKLLGVTRQTIYNWVGTYGQADSERGLADARRTGRPSLWTEQADRLLRRTLEAQPDEPGLIEEKRSTPVLQRVLMAQLGQAISEETIRRRLKHLGYAWSGSGYVKVQPASQVPAAGAGETGNISYPNPSAIAA